jgi:phosphate acetyltransferase
VAPEQLIVAAGRNRSGESRDHFSLDQRPRSTPWPARNNLDIGTYEIIDVLHSDAAAAKAVELIHESKGELLMKGGLHTDELMREVTSGKTGFRTARRISHVFIMDVPTYSETLFVTDVAINIFPDLDAKRDIIQSAIDLFSQTGLGTPRVAILSAVETVTAKIPSTIDAAALCKMADRGQITGGILGGPLAFDNAIDPEAAKIKGINSPVAGRAQILVVPDLEAGNVLAKNLVLLAKADAAGIALGARVSIVLIARRFRAGPHGLVCSRCHLCRRAPTCCGRARGMTAASRSAKRHSNSNSIAPLPGVRQACGGYWAKPSAPPRSQMPAASSAITFCGRNLDLHLREPAPSGGDDKRPRRVDTFNLGINPKSRTCQRHPAFH